MAQCPQCGHEVSTDAKVCPQCRQSIGSQSSLSAPPVHAVPAYSPPLEDIVPDSVQQATRAARSTGSAVWQASKKSQGCFYRWVTLGGRAAFTQLVYPSALAEGPISSQPTYANTPVFIEIAALLFVLACLIGPFIFLIARWEQALFLFISVFLTLLAMNLIGFRWPAFSWLTFGRLLGRFKGGNVPEIRFRVDDADQGFVDVHIVGPRQQKVDLAAGQMVRVYGVPEPGQNQVRACKIEVYEPTGQPLNTMTATRLLPLVTMLLLPTIAWFVVWLIVQGVRVFTG